MVGAFSTGILVVRKVEASLGVGLPNQGEAIQEPTGVCRPLDMAPLNFDGLPGLLLRTLQRIKLDQGWSYRRAHHHP